MSNRVVIQEGYVVPSFDGYKRKPARRTKRRSTGSMPAAVRAQQSKMKVCAKAWSSGRALASSYRAHMKKCL